jgi:hypothetical protein
VPAPSDRCESRGAFGSSGVSLKANRVAQFAGAIGGAHSPLFYLRWRHACGFVVHPRLVSAKNPPAMVADQVPTIDRAIIRIKSARKWPEKVVLDTSHPPITPPAVEEPPTAEPARLPSDEAGNQSNLEAMAQLKPDTQPAAVDRPTSQVKRGVARTARSKRRTTRRLARAEAGGCCQFGCIDNGQTTSNAMSRRRAASSMAYGSTCA